MCIGFSNFILQITQTSVLRITEEILREWNESNRVELEGMYHRFMTSLTESSNEETGRMRLYLLQGMRMDDGGGNSLRICQL